MMTKVKVCGITSPDDAAMAVELGADALGFIFAESPRRVSPEKAREIILTLPPFVKTVGVFVDEAPDVIRRMQTFCGLDLLQLHGEEPPDLCLQLMPRAIKAFRLKDESSLKAIPPYKGRTRALLFDTYSKEKRGGTGRTFDWDLAIRGKALGMPVILSGGLGPSNIEKAISTVSPFAVDVNSGVEEFPGKKSPELLKDLMKRVRRMQRGKPDLEQIE